LIFDYQALFDECDLGHRASPSKDTELGKEKPEDLKD
jgi:hypothetical protein